MFADFVNIEYKNGENGYPKFFESIRGKKVVMVFDVNTRPFAIAFQESLSRYAAELKEVYFPENDLVPDEHVYGALKKAAKKSDYILAVGSGSLNDTAKYVSTALSIPCGVLATAASMDGYISKGAAIMKGHFKVTEPVHTPSDVLIDLDIIANAPKRMTAAGFGDIVGKYTSLTDWKLSNLLNGEPIDKEAYELMETAMSECVDAFDGLIGYEKNAVAKLMNALLTAGLSMAKCGNSRPASGSEHHQSHFLEMDFVRRGEPIPLHGLKVAIGTLISIELYRALKEKQVELPHAEEVYALADALPDVESVKGMLEKMGCPVRFSLLGVRKETMEAMLDGAYAVRDRFTVLTLYHNLGIMDGMKAYLMKKYY